MEDIFSIEKELYFVKIMEHTILQVMQPLSWDEYFRRLCNSFIDFSEIKDLFKLDMIRMNK